MFRRLVVGAFTLATLLTGGWDQRDAARALDNMGFDPAAIDAFVNAAAPAFEVALQQSRDAARQRGTQPIPPQIRAALQGFYDDDTLDRATFNIGDDTDVTVANLAISYGDAAAVTLIDIIVFKEADLAYNDAALWAHELRHVQQFRDWGVHAFALRYLQNWNDVEADASGKAAEFVRWRSQRPKHQ